MLKQIVFPLWFVASLAYSSYAVGEAVEPGHTPISFPITVDGIKTADALLFQWHARVGFLVPASRDPGYRLRDSGMTRKKAAAEMTGAPVAESDQDFPEAA